MPTTTFSFEEARKLYESVRPSDGPYSQGDKIQVMDRDGAEIIARVDGKEKRLFDLHGQILCYSISTGSIVKEVREELGGIGMSVFAPDFTHPIIDQAQAILAAELERNFGEPYHVSFHSSGTRANENALRVARAVLGGRMHVVMLREGYHGAGLMSHLCGHAKWKGQATLPLAVPVTFIEAPHTEEIDPDDLDEGEFPMNTLFNFERAAETEMARDAKPFFMAEAGVQGVAGFQKLDSAILKRMITKTHEMEGLVLLDCVQTMPWRTAENLFMLDGICRKDQGETRPDMITSAKGNGAGFPFAFLAVRKALWDGTALEQRGKDYDTYGRILEGALAFQKVISILGTEGGQKRLQESAGLLTETLEVLLSRFGIEKTGTGLMQGLALGDDQEVAKFKKIGLHETGLLVASGGLYGNILRLGFPIDATKETIREGIKRVTKTLERLDQ